MRKKRLRGLQGGDKGAYVVDTGVLIEYLDESSPLARKVEALFEDAIKGEVVLHTVSSVIAELLYVAHRFYAMMKIPEPNRRAYEYLAWLQHYVGLRVISLDDRLALEVGELKKALRIALTDCAVIACARRINATPLFRRIEREMEPVLAELKRLGVAFLEHINPL